LSTAVRISYDAAREEFQGPVMFGRDEETVVRG
jgi:hypothetical protein